MTNRNRLATAVYTLGITILGAALGLPACSEDATSSPGGTTPTTADSGTKLCDPGSRSCKSVTAAQSCSADGTALTDIPCATGERCSGGACVSSTSPNVCQDATKALRRKDDGTFEVVTCPAGTVCTGAGLCQGAFLVGSSVCEGLQNVATSADGLTRTLAACAAGELCVSTGDTNGVPTAACKTAECIPRTPNLAFCGNPSATSAEQNKAISTCTATPAGYKLLTALCGGSSVCVPGIPANPSQNLPATAASCKTDCVPGTTRCSGNGLVTCDSTGKFAAVTACGVGKACFPSASDPSKAVCGDAVCQRGIGACSAAGIRVCDANGALAATAAPCATGTCKSDGQGGGFCFAECQEGEERCVSDNATSFQTCVNGNWSATATACASNAVCRNFRSATGKRAKLCGGECTPGTQECSLPDGGAGASAVRVCDATGRFGTPTACAVGRCQASNGQAACVADCVPNSLVCTGGSTNVPGTPYAGTTSFARCSDKGLVEVGPSTDCEAGTFCRQKNGVVLAPVGATNACVACVGTAIAGGNEDNVVDTRCSSAAGDNVGSEGSQTCSAANTWISAGVTACTNGCTGPATASGTRAPFCRNTSNNGNLQTETYYASRRRGSCLGSKRSSNPVVCGATVDCCESACERPVPARLSSCNPAPVP